MTKIWWYVFIIVLALWLLWCGNVYSNVDNTITIHENLSPGEKIAQFRQYKERGEKYACQVQDEIKRHHEIELEKVKAEVYAKELQLQSPKIYVNSSSSARVKNNFHFLKCKK